MAGTHYSNLIKSIFGKFEPLNKFLGVLLSICGVAKTLGNSGIISHYCVNVVVTILSFALLSFLFSMQVRFTWIAIASEMTGSALLVVAFVIIALALMPLQLRIIFIIALLVAIAFCFYALLIKEDANVVEQEKIDEVSAADSMELSIILIQDDGEQVDEM